MSATADDDDGAVGQRIVDPRGDQIDPGVGPEGSWVLGGWVLGGGSGRGLGGVLGGWSGRVWRGLGGS